MVDAARAAGADAIKFQTFRAEEFVGDPTLEFTYRSQGKSITEPMRQMFKRCEFSAGQWRQLRGRCDERGILFLSTPQNPSDLAMLLELGLPAIKVGSDDFTNLPLIRQYAAHGLPLILSCGMANLGEIHQTLECAGAFKGAPVVLLLCVSEYPTPPDHVHLRRLSTLGAAFPGIPLGFSDHTQGPLASALAVSFGACVFEKHFTLDQNLPGPDHWFSENTDGLKLWVQSIRTAHQILGDGRVQCTPAEEQMKVLARRSIVSLCDIAAGEILTDRHIGLRRPGNGLPPSLFEFVLGLKTTRPIAKGTLIKSDDLKEGPHV
jgi:sialic acid synthase SpsE